MCHCIKIESRHEANFVIAGGAAGCHFDNCGAHSDDKFGIVTTVDLRYYTHGMRMRQLETRLLRPLTHFINFHRNYRSYDYGFLRGVY